MAKTIDPALAQRLLHESEQTNYDAYPASATGRRPNRQKVYSVRLSADEEAEVQRVAAAKHLPHQPSSAPGSSNDSIRNAPPDLSLPPRAAAHRRLTLACSKPRSAPQLWP